MNAAECIAKITEEYRSIGMKMGKMQCARLKSSKCLRYKSVSQKAKLRRVKMDTQWIQPRSKLDAVPLGKKITFDSVQLDGSGAPLRIEQRAVRRR
eukprot:6489668-Amphidinium_carterae.1